MRDRARALLIHLGFSAALVSTVLAVAYFLWYPPPLARAAGLTTLALVITGVDMVMGPVLTFVVFDRAKKSLRFDLICIVVLQLAVLAYGVHIVGEARPVWIVFNADRFDLVLAHDLEKRFLDIAKPEYQSRSWFGPRWVASVNPTDVELRNTLLLESAMGGPDLPQRPDLYVPLGTQGDSIKRLAKPIDGLKLFNSDETVAKLREDWPGADGWLPLMARAQPMVVLVRRADAKVLGVAPLRPWHP